MIHKFQDFIFYCSNYFDIILIVALIMFAFGIVGIVSVFIDREERRLQ